jgi:hypothetical protein
MVIAVQNNRKQYNMAHARFMIYNQVYRHTLRISNKYCFSITTTVTQTRLSVTSYVIFRFYANEGWWFSRNTTVV